MVDQHGDPSVKRERDNLAWAFRWLLALLISLAGYLQHQNTEEQRNTRSVLEFNQRQAAEREQKINDRIAVLSLGLSLVQKDAGQHGVDIKELRDIAGQQGRMIDGHRWQLQRLEDRRSP